MGYHILALLVYIFLVALVSKIKYYLKQRDE